MCRSSGMDRENTLKHSDSILFLLCHPQSSCDLFTKVFFDFVQPPKLLFTCQGPLKEENLALHNTSNEERGRLAPQMLLLPWIQACTNQGLWLPCLRDVEAGGATARGPGVDHVAGGQPLPRLGRLLCKELLCVKTSLCKSPCVCKSFCASPPSSFLSGHTVV